MTLIAAHRGGAGQWPENSPTAFRATAGLAVDQVEFDIHPTADGEIVVIHDPTLERTTSGAGPVAARTLAELRHLTLRGTGGEGSGGEGSGGETLLTLAELTALFAPTAIALRMEIKWDAAHRAYPGLLGRALGVLDAAGMRGRTVVTSFLLPVAAEAAATPGLAGAIWLVAPDLHEYLGTGGIAAAARLAGVATLGLRADRLDAALLATLRAAGFGVGCWGVKDEAAIRRVLALGVDVFTADQPELALRLRADSLV